MLVERGSFYDGDRTALTFNRARVNLSPQLSVEPNVSVNWIDLPAGSFTTSWWARGSPTRLTPLLFASALVQYNSSTHTVSANARLRWEYRPGSELFVVYNEERDTRRRLARPVCRTALHREGQPLPPVLTKRYASTSTPSPSAMRFTNAK